MTVRDLLGVSLQRRAIFFGFGSTLARQMSAMLQEVGASEALLDKPVEKISGGELQRVLLALAMQPEPELLLLDEPAAGIDVKGQEQFYDVIGRLNRERDTTILLVSHDLSMVGKHVQRVMCLKDGLVHCKGTPQEITPDTFRQVFGNDQNVFVHDH